MVGVATTPAVVVRGELNGLGVVRSLSRGGVPSIVVDTTRRHAALWSRSCRARIVDQLHGRGFVDSLLALQREIGGRPVLILTDEMAVNTVSENRSELEDAFRFDLPPPPMVSVLANKARFQEFAERHGLPVPHTIVLARESDLVKLRGLRFPVIVKPADKRPVYLGETERLHVIARIEDAEPLCETLLQAAGELVAQEWIEGPDSDIYFCLFCRGREHSTMFSGRKILCHPPKVGTTAICLAAPEAADCLEIITSGFLDLCEYRGLGSLEFKWDARRKVFLIIEPTVGRTDWQEEIATLNGVNIPLAAYRGLMGLPAVGQTPPGRAAAWQESYAYWRGRAALPARLRVHDGYWRPDDPMPAFMFYGNAALDRLQRRVAPLFFGGRAIRRHGVTAVKQS